jgi:hypothetical protein
MAPGLSNVSKRDEIKPLFFTVFLGLICDPLLLFFVSFVAIFDRFPRPPELAAAGFLKVFFLDEPPPTSFKKPEKQ